MDLLNILKYSVALVAVLIIVSVLLQTRSGGLGSVFGGAGSSDIYKSRRGFEAFLYNSTVVLAVLLVVLSLGISILSV